MTKSTTKPPIHRDTSRNTVRKKLTHIEKEVRKGRTDLDTLEFWPLVKKIKNDKNLIDKYSYHVGRIDKKAFNHGPTLPLVTGTLICILLTTIGALTFYTATGGTLPLNLHQPLQSIPPGALLLTATILLTTALHPLTHLITGKLVGINFHYYFLNGSLHIEPTLKTDYATYLQTPPTKRATMHISASITSTLIPLITLTTALLNNTQQPYTTLLTLLTLYILTIEILPATALLTNKWRILGINLRKTDLGRAHREYQLKNKN